MRSLLLTLVIFCLSFFAHADKNPTVTLHTSMGDITLELFPEEAPITVANFLEYAESGFYEGTIFHRVIPYFAIQAGGFTKGMTRKETRPNIVNEASNGLKNKFLTVAMARADDPDSASSQFFINLDNNRSLNYDERKKFAGYTVFGRVTKGKYVVQDISDQETGNHGYHKDVPLTPIVIKSVTVHKAKK